MRLCVGLVLICSAAFFSDSALGQPAAKEPERRIGNINIIGNEFTRDEIIRRAVGVYPGQVLRYSDLHVAEDNLRRLGSIRIRSSQWHPAHCERH